MRFSVALSSGTVHERVAGVGSTSPAASRAAVPKRWVPWLSAVSRTDGAAQGSAAPSREQAKLEPAALEA